MIKSERLIVSPALQHANANIKNHYALESAAWVWHRQYAADRPVALQFRNRFTISQTTEITLHVSADNRYELTLDGQFLSMGPDRSDVKHWSFASYKITLEAGEHDLQAQVWWLDPKLVPHAQCSIRGGFICAIEGIEGLNTGEETWEVQPIEGWSLALPDFGGAYFAAGPNQTIDGQAFFHHTQAWTQPTIVGNIVSKSHKNALNTCTEHSRMGFIGKPLADARTGVIENGWKLYPSPLPDMIRRDCSTGTIRAIQNHADDKIVTSEDCQSPQISAWQDLLSQQKPVTVAAHTQLTAVIDLEQYYCGFGKVNLTGGSKSSLSIKWAESLFHLNDDGQRTMNKGNRNEVLDKIFFGAGETFCNDGEADRNYQGHWWRSGRYLQISVTTQEDPLQINAIGFIETRYPLENELQWESSDAKLDAIVPLGVRGMQMCSHETFMDCPYYEQMMYVGDTRLEMLTWHVMSQDSTLVKRGLELFNFSRSETGFIAERYPSTPYQLSLTFSMIWVLALHDFSTWRNEAKWMQQQIPGLRCLLENFRGILNEQGLLENMPGWSFMDWVPQWSENCGCAPDGETGTSSTNNLLFIYALQKAAQVELAHGDPDQAAIYQKLAEKMASTVKSLFWNETNGCLADDLAQQKYSEHTICLSLLTGILNETQTQSSFQTLLTHTDIARATVYFSFYLFEVLYQFGRGDLILQKMDFWKELLPQGFKTPVEKPEPSRSDCHAWGSHPLFHYHASLAGIRPISAGFEAVRIAPSPGSLKKIQSVLPHPQGEIKVILQMSKDLQDCHATITLPSDTTGVFVWKNVEYPLIPAAQTIIQTQASQLA